MHEYAIKTLYIVLFGYREMGKETVGIVPQSTLLAAICLK